MFTFIKKKTGVSADTEEQGSCCTGSSVKPEATKPSCCGCGERSPEAGSSGGAKQD